jgi:hypothetical protein
LRLDRSSGANSTRPVPQPGSGATADSSCARVRGVQAAQHSATGTQGQ